MLLINLMGELIHFLIIVALILQKQHQIFIPNMLVYTDMTRR